MSVKNWSCVAFFIVFTLALNIFKYIYYNPVRNSSICAHEQEPALLCDKKMALKDAIVSDFANIPGISVKTARLIVNFINYKSQNLEDLVLIKGVGPKTVEKLREYFY